MPAAPTATARGLESQLAGLARNRAGHHRLPLPARHVQVEQDRAPAVLPHHPQLAGPAADDDGRPVAGSPRPPPARADRAPRSSTPLLPHRAGVSDERMTRLENRVLDRHHSRGEWNYTIRASPRPPGPGTRPGARRPPALASPPSPPCRRITDYLPALYRRRRTYPRRRPRATAAPGPRSAAAVPAAPRPGIPLPFAAVVTAAACPAASASATGCSANSSAPPTPPSASPPATSPRSWPARHHPEHQPNPHLHPRPATRTRRNSPQITITLPEPPQPHTRPKTTLQTPDTPQTHVISGRVPTGVQMLRDHWDRPRTAEHVHGPAGLAP